MPADTTIGRQDRPQSSPGPSRARPRSAVADAPRLRPASAPVYTRPASATRGFGEQTYLPKYNHEPINKDWKPGDWAAGWEPHPIKESFPRWTIPTNAKGKGDEKSKGFRDTYLCVFARSKQHIPGPGAHKALRHFCEPKTAESFGKPKWETKDPRRLTPRCLREDDGISGANRQAPRKKDDETDAKMVNMTRPRQATIPRAQRNACLTDMRKATRMPSSFHTPGPGEYSQYTTFGQKSGACTKGYVGTMPCNNPYGTGKLTRRRSDPGLHFEDRRSRHASPAKRGA